MSFCSSRRYGFYPYLHAQRLSSRSSHRYDFYLHLHEQRLSFRSSHRYGFCPYLHAQRLSSRSSHRYGFYPYHYADIHIRTLGTHHLSTRVLHLPQSQRHSSSIFVREQKRFLSSTPVHRPRGLFCQVLRRLYRRHHIPPFRYRWHCRLSNFRFQTHRIRPRYIFGYAYRHRQIPIRQRYDRC